MAKTDALNRGHLLSAGLLTGFIALYWYVMAGHVLWRDEALPILLARNNSSLMDLFQAMRYEGTPGLWHAILWLTDQVVFLTPAAAKIWHFLFFSVFLSLLLFGFRVPNLIKLALLTQQSLIFFNAANVRQYQMAAALILLFFFFYKRGGRRGYILMCATLFFLSLTALHGIIISFGLLIFLALNEHARTGRLFNKYLLIPLAGLALGILQILPPEDLMAGVARWDFRFSIGELWKVTRHVISDATLGAVFIIEIALLVTIMSRGEKIAQGFWVRHFVFCFGIVLIGFLCVRFFKYSGPRHHFLLTYLGIGFLLTMIELNAEKVKRSKLFLLLIPLVVISAMQFSLHVYHYLRYVHSNSRAVAEFLDTHYPEKDILSKSEILEAPIRAYRKSQVPVFALGRQDFVTYTVWNHHSVDYRDNETSEYLLLSELKQDILGVPENIISQEPVLVLAGRNSIEEMNDLGLAAFDRIPLSKEITLSFIRSFDGARKENYYLFALEYTKQDGDDAG